MLAASIVIISESGALITTPILLGGGFFRGGDFPRGGRVIIGAPLSDLITCEAANI